jgi:hypothetical protein
MTSETLDRLLSVKHSSCLSIIIPQFRLSRNRMQNPEQIRKTIRKAKTILKRNPSAAGRLMMEKLDSLLKSIHADYSRSGLGLYISPDLAELVYFPFEVKEKIIHDTTFETRDIYYLKAFLSPYYAVVLNKKTMHFYTGAGDELMEIRDGIFPMHDEEEYEYARPSLGNSYGYAMKGFEKDKSIVSHMREESFYKETGYQLDVYLNRSKLPLLVAGTRKQVAEFFEATQLKERTAGVITGSFGTKNLFDLRTKAWVAYVAFRQEETETLIRELQENAQPARLAKGIQEVWQAANQGKGHLLLVEKDYMPRAYLRDNDPVLYLQPPHPKYTVVPDAVDSIIETVVEKGGHVQFTEDKRLRSFDSIALQLRY